MGKIINGQLLAEKIKQDIKRQVSRMSFKPGLGLILVGNNPASKIYLANKAKVCQQVGFYWEKIVLPASASQKRLLKIIEKLNTNPKTQGILVQLPLPQKIDKNKIAKAVIPQKDVDCFHPDNVAKLALINQKTNLANILVPGTAKGVISLIESTGRSIRGKKAVVVGRSDLTGRPIALLLLAKNATVTICHSKTIDLKKETKQADILVSAVGKPGLIRADMVKKGAIVIDVGINRTKKGLVGDVDFDRVKKVAGFITPVPKGVGPMTIVTLLKNTLLLAKNAS